MSLSTLSRMRKRVLSNTSEKDAEDAVAARRKRPKISTSRSSSDLRRSLLDVGTGESFAGVGSSSDGLRRSSSFSYADDSERSIHLPRAISSTAIFSRPTSPSTRASSPSVSLLNGSVGGGGNVVGGSGGSGGNGSGGTSSSTYIDEGGLALMRSVSVSSIRSETPPIHPICPDTSAKYHLRNTKIVIEYSVPFSSSLALTTAPVTTNTNGNTNGITNTTTTTTNTNTTVVNGTGGILNGNSVANVNGTSQGTDVESVVSPHLISCSPGNVLFFSRGNRVHFKNLASPGSGAEEIVQLCKLGEDRGDLRVIECAGSDIGETVALGTSKGFVQIWDVKTKKMKMSWSTKGVSVMRWNGAVLTVGGLKGTIRHYDTRVEPKSKMKDQAPKWTRHQTRITSLGWNSAGKLLASGDESGTVYCWEQGKKVPLDVGEFVQRRKKMQHAGSVSALAWCPWYPKLLATGDTKGILRLWNVEASTSGSNVLNPGKLELGASITAVHFSPHVKEILTVHGAAVVDDTESPSALRAPRVSVANSVSVHCFPSLRHINTMRVLDKPNRDCVLNAQGTKIVVEVPEEGKLGMCDVWSKRKELKRHSSFLDSAIR